MATSSPVRYEISTSTIPRRYCPNPYNVAFYWITENNRVELTTLAHALWTLHEDDEREVILYVTVDDWELEILFRILGKRCVFISQLATVTPCIRIAHPSEGVCQQVLLSSNTL
jgi:hypothetical protein